HLQDDSGVLRIVLVPRVEYRFPVARLRNRRDAHNLDAGERQPMRERAMIVARGLEAGADAAAQTLNEEQEAIEVLGCVGHLEPVALASGSLDKEGVRVAAHVNCKPVKCGGSIGRVSHDGDLLRSSTHQRMPSPRVADTDSALTT